MKKIIAMLMGLLMIFALVSCGNRPSTTETTTGTTETNIPPEQEEDAAYYRRGHLFAEAETRILYFQSKRTLYQYNKLTEEYAVFCFDPLCTHGKECISDRFHYLNPAATGTGNMSMDYCEADNRYYFTRGEQLYSVAFDGSDAKLACSFGEAGKFENDKNGLDIGGANAVSFMGIYDQYVYFFTLDSEEGTRTLKRYDVKTGEVKDIFHRSRSESTITFYGFVDGYLYVGLVGDVYGVYRMNLDGTEMTKLHDDILEPKYVWGIFDGECVYAVNDTREGIYEIEAYSIASGEKKLVLAADKVITLLAVTNDSIYYTKNEPRSIGYKITNTGGKENKDEVINDRSRIYCMDKKTGETKVVLDDITCSVNDIHFFGDAVMINGWFCKVDETNAKKTPAPFIANVDENGVFTELTLLE